MTNDDADFETWISELKDVVYAESGVQFHDADSVRQDYEDGRDASDVAMEIAEEYNGKVKVCKVNVDDQGELAAQNAIVSIPTVILFIDGKPVKKIVGAHSLDDYEDAIDEFI